MNNYNNDEQYNEGTSFEKHGAEDIAAPPGMTLKLNQMADDDEFSRVISFLDSIFSVAIMEKPKDEILTIDDKTRGQKIRYMARPYEYMCTENVSFLLRILRSTKLGEGLNFMLKDNGLQSVPLFQQTMNESQYKTLKVKGNRQKMQFRVQYVIKSKNTANNFLEFIRAPKL